ncbi:alpha/beta fold hydrolase [Shewanella surugensis]|uniref:Alpha/beta hydrolase n=1 Tax=Shewanella surugensis TaxID=212020 RepID=A0ABT0L5P1_9GAMM|nr:alpha/beta hydrolase [Shewanella surugensis]MCL1122996.1 alpha/beta hydrolase [Shewanella surugensis]
MGLADKESHYFYTNDGVKLHYLDKGEGQVIVMLPSWSQSVEQYHYQIQTLSQKYRTIALDMRGHGLSQQVEYGYKVYRLAKDVDELLVHLSLDNVVLLGHALGAAVILCYWDLFGSDKISKLILVERVAALVSNPEWTPQEIADFGPLVDPDSAMEIYNTLISAKGDNYKAILLNHQMSSKMPAKEKQWLIQNSINFPGKLAAALIYNHFHQDWRDVIPRITVPTLIVGGRASPTSVSSQEWMHQQIKGSQLVIFDEEEGGKHFMFIEGADQFNHLVDEFMKAH